MSPQMDEPKIREVMNESPVFIDPDIPVKEAAEVLKNEDVGSLVVKKGRDTKGILTNSDIVNKYVLECEGNTAEDIMSEDIISTSPEKGIEDAAIIMVEKGIERLAVKSNGEIIGMISANDIIKVQPSLYLEISQGLKLGEERFGRMEEEVEVGKCDSCENYSENLEPVAGQMLCEECREEMGAI